MKSVFSLHIIRLTKKTHVAVQSENLLQELIPTKGMQFTSYEAA